MAEPAAMLRRRVSSLGDPPAPILHIPAAYARLEGLTPGTEIAVLFDQGILVVAPVGREAQAAEVLKGLRRRAKLEAPAR